MRASQLAAHPRLGERLPGFEPRELRCLSAGGYELRYELAADASTILRVFHVREDR